MDRYCYITTERITFRIWFITPIGQFDRLTSTGLLRQAQHNAAQRTASREGLALLITP